MISLAGSLWKLGFQSDLIKLSVMDLEDLGFLHSLI